MNVLRSSSSVKTRRMPSGLSGPQTKQVFLGRLRLLVSWPWTLPGMQRILPDAVAGFGFYETKSKSTKSKSPPSFAQNAKEGRGTQTSLCQRSSSTEFFFRYESCIHIGFGFALED